MRSESHENRLNLTSQIRLHPLTRRLWFPENPAGDKIRNPRQGSTARFTACPADRQSGILMSHPHTAVQSIIALAVCLIATRLAAAPSYPPTFKDARVEIYKKLGSTELRLWIFGKSDSRSPKPAIVFFFGGGWNAGSPAQFEEQARHFARRGMIAITADYRVKSRHGVQVVECVKDAKAALAWTRENARRLGIDPNRIAVSGGSAGGHLAAATGTISGIGSDERPNAMILFNPACSLAPIGDWKPPRNVARELNAGRLGVEPKVISPAHHIGLHTPPTLILHGRQDTTVPYASVVAFERAMKQAARPCKLVGYEGAEHGFFNNGEGYSSTLAEADAFLVDLGWIKK
jgi:acetyl esterase/lipase